MFTLKNASLPFAAFATLLLSMQASAEAPTVRTFRSIEFEAGSAAVVDDVRADLLARIPAGSPVGDARALLRAAGAHCRAPNSGQMRCRYNDTHIEDDIIQDVSWTLDFQTSGDRIASFTVARNPAHD